VNVLSIDEVDVSRGDIPVLHDITLHVAPGEAVCLLGRNGMGKTTLLRTVMGLTRASGGRISLEDTEIERLSPHAIARLGIGYVPQGRGIFSKLSVEENLIVGRRRGKDDELLDEMYELFPVLAERRRHSGATLSGGEQQMLAIARCLIRRPKLILLDEPTEGLQPSLVQRLAELLPEIRERFAVSYLLVEQNIDFAFSVTDRGHVLEGGRIAVTGTIPELRDHTLIIEYLAV
jgi:branched-chain amino acid transport system ATP-binding protein